MDSDSGDVEVEMMDIIPSAPSLSLSEDDDPGEGDSESLLLPEKDEQKNKNLERGGSTMVDEDEYFGGKGLSAHHEDHEDIIVKVENVHKTYLLGIEGIAALRGVSMSVKRGEFVCIFGTSGGGKTRFCFSSFFSFFSLPRFFGGGGAEVVVVFDCYNVSLVFLILFLTLVSSFFFPFSLLSVLLFSVCSIFLEQLINQRKVPLIFVVFMWRVKQQIES